jgi:hypothetical protein
MGYRKSKAQQHLETRTCVDARKDESMTLRDDVSEMSRLQDSAHEMIDGRDAEIASLKIAARAVRDDAQPSGDHIVIRDIDAWNVFCAAIGDRIGDVMTDEAIPAPLPTTMEFGPEHPKDVPYYMAGCMCSLCKRLRRNSLDQDTE